MCFLAFSDATVAETGSIFAHSLRIVRQTCLSPPYLPLLAGTRKEARVDGKTVLLFWYRNQIYAIEARWAHISLAARVLVAPCPSAFNRTIPHRLCCPYSASVVGKPLAYQTPPPTRAPPPPTQVPR